MSACAKSISPHMHHLPLCVRLLQLDSYLHVCYRVLLLLWPHLFGFIYLYSPTFVSYSSIVASFSTSMSERSFFPPFHPPYQRRQQFGVYTISIIVEYIFLFIGNVFYAYIAFLQFIAFNEYCLAVIALFSSTISPNF